MTTATEAKETPILKAISVRAPWWWFILHAGKDIENRDWTAKFRGTVYLHASKYWRKEDIYSDFQTGCDIQEIRGLVPGWPDKFALMERYRGHIVGRVDIVDCVSSSDSPWFFGKFGFVLSNPVAFENPIPCKGALGFFTVPQRVGQEIRALSFGKVEGR